MRKSQVILTFSLPFFSSSESFTPNLIRFVVILKTVIWCDRRDHCNTNMLANLKTTLTAHYLTLNS